MKKVPQSANFELAQNSKSNSNSNLPEATVSQRNSTLRTTQTGYLSSEVRLANPGVDAFFFEANRPLFASSRNNEAIAFMAKRVIEGIPTEDSLRLLFAGSGDNFREAFEGILDGETGILVRTLFSIQDEYLSKIDDSLYYATGDVSKKLSFNKLAFSKALMLLTTLSSLNLSDSGKEVLLSVANLSTDEVANEINELQLFIQNKDLRKLILDQFKVVSSSLERYVAEIKTGLASPVVSEKLKQDIIAVTKSIVFSADGYPNLINILGDSDKTLKLEICELIAYQTLLVLHDAVTGKAESISSSRLGSIFISAMSDILPNTTRTQPDPAGTVFIGSMITNLKNKLNTLANDELAKGFVGVHKAIRNANHQRESLISFLHDRTGTLSSSFENIEALSREFVHTIILIANADSVEAAKAYLEAFKSQSTYRSSGASQMINASTISRGIDSDSLKKVLATMTDGNLVKAFNAFLPDSIKGLDVATSADLPSIPGVPTRRLSFDATQVASITVSTPSRLEKINDLDVTNMGSIFHKKGSTQEITPLMFFILRMNSLIGNPEIDRSILGDKNTSFLMDGIQLPSIIKDSLLAEIRSISIALSLELNVKREAFRDWGVYSLLSVKDLVKYLGFFVNQNSLSFLVEGAHVFREKRLSSVTEALNEAMAKIPSHYDVSSTFSNGLPLFHVISSDDNEIVKDPTRELSIIRSLLDDKKHTHQLIDYITKVAKFSLSDDLASTRSVLGISHVLELEPGVFSKTGSSLIRGHEFESYDGGRSHEALVEILASGTVQGIKSKLIPGFYGPALQYMISLNPNAVGLNGMLDFKGLLKSRWNVQGNQTNPDSLTERALGIMFNNLFSYRLISSHSQTMNLSYLYRKQGGIFLALLRYAWAPFEGASYGFVPDQVSVVPSPSGLEVLEKVLNVIGLSRFDRISKKEAVDVESLLSAPGSDSYVPITVKSNFLELFKDKDRSGADDDGATGQNGIFGAVEGNSVLLGDILQLSKYGKKMISSEILSFRGMIYLRTSEFIDMMCSDLVSVSESGQMKTFWMNRAREIFFRENEERIEIISRAELNLGDRETMSDAHAKNLLVSVYNNFKQIFSGVLDYGMDAEGGEIVAKTFVDNKSTLRNNISGKEVQTKMETAMASNADFFKERMAAAKAKMNANAKIQPAKSAPAALESEKEAEE